MNTARVNSVAVGPDLLDAPTDRDHRRIRNARRMARTRCREIEASRDAAMERAFRVEMGATIRSASPVLIAVLAIEDLELDAAVEMLQPQFGWPARPRLSGPNRARSIHSHLLRYYATPRLSQFSTRPPTQISQPPLLYRTFDRADGGYLQLQVVDHSVEVETRIEPTWIETRFGELSIELDFELNRTGFVGGSNS